MRAHSDDLADVLTGSISRRLWADVFFGSDRQMQGLELTGWTIDWDLTSDIKSNGSATVVYQSEAGESLVPEGTGGVLSPFKARLLLSVEVSAETFTETVVLGWYQITGITAAYDNYMDGPAGKTVVSSVVKIEFMSLDETVRRRGFRLPENPPANASTYAELRRITGMPVAATVADKNVNPAITYETSEGGRLKAVQSHFGFLGGVGVVDTSGAWRLIPHAIGDPVGSLVVGPNGTVTDVGYSIDTTNVFNVVIGTGEGPNREPLYYPAVATGALDPSGLYTENTTYYNSSTATTQEQLTAETEAVLSQSVGGQTYEVPVQCIFNPLYELGDVLQVVGHTRDISGRVVKVSLSDAALMNVTLEVPRGV